MQYHGIDLSCTITVDAGRLHVDVQYAVRQVDACFTFQSIADDSEHCSYVVNYINFKSKSIGVFHHQSQIKINYFTYLKSSRLNNESYCKDKEHGVQVVKREPRLEMYYLDEKDEARDGLVR